MGNKTAAVDQYIMKAASFAQPILNHLRELVHIACPEVEEKIKWGFPNFDYKGPLCSMAAFKQHAAFGFWKAALMKDPLLKETAAAETAMGHLGKISSLKDLPSDKKIINWIKEAVALNEQGIKLPAKSKAPQTEIIMPPAFTEALKKNKKARETFEAFSYSHRKEYVQWIAEAKTEATRDKRIATSLEWLSENKSRNWKYEKK